MFLTLSDPDFLTSLGVENLPSSLTLNSSRSRLKNITLKLDLFNQFNSTFILSAFRFNNHILRCCHWHNTWTYDFRVQIVFVLCLSRGQQPMVTDEEIHLRWNHYVVKTHLTTWRKWQIWKILVMEHLHQSYQVNVH